MVYTPAHAVTQTDIGLVNDVVTNASKRNTTLEAGFVNAFELYGLADFIALAHFANVGSSYSQIGNIFFQSGLEGSVIVVNTGAIDPAIGIEAEIVNTFIGSANFTGIVLAKGLSVAGNLNQEANVDAGNRLVSTIDVDNNARIAATDVGIYGAISNSASASGISHSRLWPMAQPCLEASIRLPTSSTATLSPAKFQSSPPAT
jgi:hypothetical protein